MTEFPLVRACELMDMAIQVENQGIDFYRGCRKLKSTIEPQVKEVFDYLIAQERLHLDLFEDLKRGLGEDYPLEESYPGEMRSYIDTFVGGRIFIDPVKATLEIEKMADAERGPKRVIDFGITFEQKSILFYSAMHGMVRPSERAAVDRVIEAEHQHIKTLLGLRRQLGVKNGDPPLQS